MRLKTIYDRLKPGFKSSLQANARKYSSAKRLKYALMSNTSWYDLTVSQVSIYQYIVIYQLTSCLLKIYYMVIL